MVRWRQFMLIGLAVMGISFFASAQAEAAVPVDQKTFPDASIREYAKRADIDGDGILSDWELGMVTQFDWQLIEAGEKNGGSDGTESGKTVDFTGMENFTSIRVVSLMDLGNGKEAWNYSGNHLFQFFPNVRKMRLAWLLTRDVGEINLTGSAAYLEELEFVGMNGMKTRLGKLDVKADRLKRLTIKELDLKKSQCNFINFPALTDLEMEYVMLPDRGISFKGLSSLEYLELLSTFSTLDLDSVKKTLKILRISDAADFEDSEPGWGSDLLRTLDISQMEKLEQVWAGNTGITKFITKDKRGKTKARRIKELHLSGCQIKSVDVTDMPRLEKLYLLDTRISSINVTKNKNLMELGIGSSTISKLNVTKNKKLDTLILWGKLGKMKKLDLSKNTSLRSLDLSVYNLAPVKIKKIVMPKLKKAMKWSDRKKSYGSGYGGRGYGASVLDLTRITKFTKNIKKYQLTMRDVDKVIISRKLKKSERKWVKKKARREGAAVIVR